MKRLTRGRAIALFVVLAAAVGGPLAWRGLARRRHPVDRTNVAKVRGPDLRASLPAWAQDPGAERGSVAGVVKSADGRAVSGAQVALLPDLGSLDGDPRLRPAGRAVSGADGRFRIGEILPGEYGLSASALGHGGAHRSGLLVPPGARLEEIELVLEGGGLELTGTVSDSGGGPIAGAEVRVAAAARSAGNRGQFVTTADASGRYRITLGKEMHLVVADADGYAPESRVVDTTLVNRADFALRPAARLAGKVVAREDGQPVAGAVVLLENGQTWWRAAQEATANDRGLFEFRDLESGGYRISAQKDAQVASPRDIEVNEADRSTEVTIEVVRGRSISGRTLSGEQPLAGARVRLRQGNLMLPGRVRATTDGDGHYRIEGVLPGRYEVMAEARAHAPSALEVALGADRDREGADLKLEPEAKVLGKVSRPDGTPATGATVLGNVVESAASRSLFGRQNAEHTDRQGRFRLGGLAAGKLTLVISEPGVGRVTWGPEALAAGETKEVELTLQPGSTVSGVVKYDDGQPAAGVSVLGVTATSMAMAQARTDEQGRFELGPLGAGATMIKASRKEGLSGMLDMGTEDRSGKKLTLTANQAEKGVELVIARGGRTLSGVVLDPDGKPLSGARVGADSSGAMLSMRAAFGAMLGDKAIVSGDDGRFTLNDLEKGPYTVWAKHGRYPDTQLDKVPDGTREVRLQFPPEAVLAGNVIDPAGHPVADFSIQAVESEGKTGADRARRSLRRMQNMTKMMGGGTSPTHDPAGAFEVRGLAAGSYDLVVTTGDGRGGHLPGVTVAAGDHKTGLRVAVDRGLTLRGQLVNTEGQAVPGLTVVVMGDQMTMKSADARGAFSFEGLVTGRKVVLFYGGQMSGYAQETRELDLPAGKTELDLGALKVRPPSTPPERAGQL